MAAVKVGRGAPRPARLERVAAIGLAVTVLATSPALGAGESPPGATVDELLVLARRLSPELAARALESDAAAARVEAAGALVGLESVAGVQVDAADGVVVSSLSAAVLARELAGVARRSGARLLEVRPLDDSLESTFRELLR